MVLLLDLTFRYTGKFIDLRHVYRKLTIIWAPQSGTNRVRAPQARASRRGSDLGSGKASWAPHRVPGRDPSHRRFSYIQIKPEPPMPKHIRLQRWAYRISGQILDTKPKTGQKGVPGELWFFLGHVKNRDCPGKSGTDGHLSLSIFG